MKTLAQVCAMLAVLALVGVVSGKEAGVAKEPAAKKVAVPRIVGEVVKLDGSTLVIKTGKAGASRSIATDAKTEVIIEGAPGKLADLKPGMKLTVTPITGTATKIEVPKAKAEKPKAEKPKADKPKKAE